LLLLAVLAYGYMPDITTLENPKIKPRLTGNLQMTGKVLGSLIPEPRTGPMSIMMNCLPPGKALIATEDKRFYRHSGIMQGNRPRMVVKTGCSCSEVQEGEAQSRSS